MNVVIATRSRYPHGPTPQRMELFRHVTVPSLLSQTDRDFTWLITVSNPDHADWIRGIAGELNLDLRTALDFTTALPETRMVRLDDDDALATDFVERLRAAGPHTPGRWYVFPNGYRVHNGRCEPYHNPTNQFIALDLPPSAFPAHVYGINHSHVRQQADVIEVDQRPAWLFVRHSESKSPGGRQVTRHDLKSLTGFSVNRSFLAGLR